MPGSVLPSVKRLQEDLEALSLIGRHGQGVSRTAFSPADMEARGFVRELMARAGMEARMDPAGNVWGSLCGKEPGLPSLVIGSHLDTVPEGGRFDGALGVLAGIECLRTLGEGQATRGRTIEVVGFSDEEGTLTSGYFGSRAMLGRLSTRERHDLGDETSDLYRTLVAAGLSPGEVLRAGRDPLGIHCYIELHAEQGMTLEEMGYSIGVVTGIVGINRYTVEIPGTARHAGTTPMRLRDDAIVKASRFILRMHEYVLGLEEQAVLTAGWLRVFPGAYNIVPGKVQVGVEARSMDPGLLDQAEAEMARVLEPLGGHVNLLSSDAPALLDDGVRQALAAAASKEGYASHPMRSGAGHDASIMARSVPSGMIFIPSRDGLSHCPQEWSAPWHLEAGLRVLYRACLDLSG
ncbi:MAG: M20 family metallo-hydrolase [Bacillota bacterium]|jgi:N-carbamoyl-L-amino-acid hydrolase